MTADQAPKDFLAALWEVCSGASEASFRAIVEIDEVRITFESRSSSHASSPAERDARRRMHEVLASAPRSCKIVEASVLDSHLLQALQNFPVPPSDDAERPPATLVHKTPPTFIRKHQKLRDLRQRTAPAAGMCASAPSKVMRCRRRWLSDSMSKGNHKVKKGETHPQECNEIAPAFYSSASDVKKPKALRRAVSWTSRSPKVAYASWSKEPPNCVSQSKPLFGRCRKLPPPLAMELKERASQVQSTWAQIYSELVPPRKKIAAKYQV
jgi:hypothetical protein